MDVGGTFAQTSGTDAASGERRRTARPVADARLLRTQDRQAKVASQSKNERRRQQEMVNRGSPPGGGPSHLKKDRFENLRQEMLSSGLIGPGAKGNHGGEHRPGYSREPDEGWRHTGREGHSRGDDPEAQQGTV